MPHRPLALLLFLFPHVMVGLRQHLAQPHPSDGPCRQIARAPLSLESCWHLAAPSNHACLLSHQHPTLECPQQSRRPHSRQTPATTSQRHPVSEPACPQPVSSPLPHCPQHLSATCFPSGDRGIQTKGEAYPLGPRTDGAGPPVTDALPGLARLQDVLALQELRCARNTLLGKP